MTCIGICKTFKVTKPSNQSHYGVGHKRCSTCEIFINWDGVKCPCCGIVLRTNPR